MDIDLSQISSDVRSLNPELALTPKTETPSKYKNIRTEFGGMRFQSGHEASVVGGLVLAERHHQGVFALRLQVRFPLAGGVIYTADAVYLDEELDAHIIDAKAWDVKTGKFLLTSEFKLKAKLFKTRYGKEIELL